MATSYSFDVTTGVDLQEVDNAVNQARKEIGQRYDFRGSRCSLELDRKAAALRLEADDEFRLEALYDVLRGRLAKRGVPLKNLIPGPLEASAGRARRIVTLQQGIPQETAKRIARDVREMGLKKVQAAIQGDQLRISSPSRDALQDVMTRLRGADYGVQLGFGNYR